MLAAILTFAMVLQDSGDAIEAAATARLSAATVVQSGANEMPDPTTVTITVVEGGTELWSGSLRVGGYGGANFSQSINEYGDPCPDADDRNAYRNANRGESLRVNIQRMRGSDGWGDDFRVQVNRDWPIDGCGDPGSDSIGLTRNVSLENGAQIRVEGGGGIVVTLRRTD